MVSDLPLRAHASQEIDAEMLQELGGQELLKEICFANQPGFVSETPVNEQPQFFFRPFPESNKAVYSTGQSYVILDLATGVKRRIPGSYDAVPTPDEEYMTIPEIESEEKGDGFAFYEIGEYKEPVLVDPELWGVYQSVAKLNNGKYRVLMERDGLYMQDYDLSEDDIKDARGFRTAKRVCGNISTTVALPMISKDGKRLSVLDAETSHTKIFKINPASGDCTLERDLGMGTGKVDFSFDNQSIVFHTYGLTENGQWFEVPSPNIVSNIYSMKLATGEIKKLTHLTNNNAVYPSFNKKGEVIVRQSDPLTGNAMFLKIDPKKESRSLPSKYFTSSESDCKVDPGYQVGLAFGKMISALCLNDANEINPANMVLLSLSMSKEQCQALTQVWEKKQEYWISDLSSIKQADAKFLKELKKSDLEAFCPKKSEALKKPVQLQPLHKEKFEGSISAFLSNIQNYCIECHRPESAHPFPVDDLDAFSEKLRSKSTSNPSKSVLQEMIDRVANGVVPPYPKAPLGFEVRNTLLASMKSFFQDYEKRKEEETLKKTDKPPSESPIERVEEPEPMATPESSR